MKPIASALVALLTTALTPAAIYGQADADAPAVTLDTVTVQATHEAPLYSAPVSAPSALRSSVPLLESSQAVSVLDEAIIRDQDARKLEDVIRNVAGVTPGGYYEDWDYYRIRGFDSSFNTFRDGLRGDNSMSPEIYGLQSVEVVKGPASTLYGQAPLGGVVNLVSKRPKKEFGGEITATGGSWEFYEGTFDINVPLLVPQTMTTTPASAKGAKAVMPITTTESGIGIYARLVGLYKNAGSYVDYVETERVYIAPSLTFEFSEDTSLTILSEYKRDWGKFAMPLPALGTALSNPNGAIPVNRYLGLPDSNELVQERYKVGYEFKHRFNDTVALRQNLSYSKMDQRWTDIFYNSYLGDDLRTAYSYPYLYGGDTKAFAVDTAVDFTFETGAARHTLTAGVDYCRVNSSGWSKQIDYSDASSYYAFDLYRPDYSAPFRTRYVSSDSFETINDSLGFYLQEHVKIGNFALTLGGRYDKFWNEDTYNGATTKDDQDAFTPKAGISYEFVPGFAAYANYSRSFTPQWGSRSATGESVDAEEGENWEAGLKYNAFDGKLTGLISVFQLTRENVATANLGTADPFDAIVSGEQRSRGFEFETTAELAPGLTLTAAYTYLDAEVTEDNEIPVGTPLLGVPEHGVSAWLKYMVQDGPLKGFGIGLGGSYYSSKSGDTYNTFDLPSYALLDAALFYERDNFSAQVNFNNVTDKRHFVGSYDSMYVLPGQPFNVSASVTWKF
jgi:iron complex outermembrane receptor protein